MLRDEDIICFGVTSWDFVRYSDRYTAVELAKTNRVLYVEPIASVLSSFRSRLAFRRWANISMGIKRVASSLYVWSHPPIFFPFPSYSSIFPRMNSSIFAAMLKRVLKKLNFTNPIVWTYFQHYEGVYLMPRVRKKLFVYDCVDEYSSYTSHLRSKKYIQRTDKWLCRNADIVFTVSKNLLEAKKKYNSHSYFVPNGVNLSHFRTFGGGAEVPGDIAEIKHPIIGLVGLINAKTSTDMALLSYLARSHPEWSVVLIGPVEYKLDKDQRRLENLHLLGAKNFEQIPSYLESFDVCIMPYLINDFTRYNFPQKLYEYMASGKPIVTTKIPACEEFKDLVRISSGKEEFALNVARALEEKDERAMRRRVETAKRSTWESLVAEKSRLVKQRLEAKER